MRSWNDHRLPELREKSPVKIMADESCYSHHDAKRLIDSKSCHYLNIKFSKSGGITEAIKIHDIAAAANIPCMMGGMLESRLALSAKLHFVYASPNIQFYDMDTCMIGHLEDPVTGGITFNGYFPDIADEPGIGADVDETFLKNCDMWTV
jgi:L-alanine-DL-glutamate epimerase-like enolase superfamily enzyme